MASEPTVRWTGSVTFDPVTRRLYYRSFTIAYSGGSPVPLPPRPFVTGDLVLLRLQQPSEDSASSSSSSPLAVCAATIASVYNVNTTGTSANKRGTFEPLPALQGGAGRVVAKGVPLETIDAPLTRILGHVELVDLDAVVAAVKKEVEEEEATRRAKTEALEVKPEEPPATDDGGGTSVEPIDAPTPQESSSTLCMWCRLYDVVEPNRSDAPSSSWRLLHSSTLDARVRSLRRAVSAASQLPSTTPQDAKTGSGGSSRPPAKGGSRGSGSNRRNGAGRGSSAPPSSTGATTATRTTELARLVPMLHEVRRLTTATTQLCTRNRDNHTAERENELQCPRCDGAAGSSLPTVELTVGGASTAAPEADVATIVGWPSDLASLLDFMPDEGAKSSAAGSPTSTTPSAPVVAKPAGTAAAEGLRRDETDDTTVVDAGSSIPPTITPLDETEGNSFPPPPLKAHRSEVAPEEVGVAGRSAAPTASSALATTKPSEEPTHPIDAVGENACQPCRPPSSGRCGRPVFRHSSWIAAGLPAEWLRLDRYRPQFQAQQQPNKSS